MTRRRLTGEQRAALATMASIGFAAVACHNDKEIERNLRKWRRLARRRLYVDDCIIALRSVLNPRDEADRQLLIRLRRIELSAVGP